MKPEKKRLPMTLQDKVEWYKAIYQKQGRKPDTGTVFMDAYMQAMDDVQAALNWRDEGKSGTYYSDIIQKVQSLVVERNRQNKAWREQHG
jgi:hypothetical protein